MISHGGKGLIMLFITVCAAQGPTCSECAISNSERRPCPFASTARATKFAPSLGASKRNDSWRSTWWEGQRSMRRWLCVLLLCLGLAWGSMACAPKLLGPTAAGYYFTVQIYPTVIFPGRTAEVLVHVQDANGHPADGVPVTFQVDPAWAQHASISPPRTSTRAGTASATFQAEIIGVAHIIVGVDTETRTVAITIIGRPSPPSE